MIAGVLLENANHFPDRQQHILIMKTELERTEAHDLLISLWYFGNWKQKAIKVNSFSIDGESICAALYNAKTNQEISSQMITYDFSLQLKDEELWSKMISITTSPHDESEEHDFRIRLWKVIVTIFDFSP